MLEDCGVVFDICHVKDSFEEVKKAILEALDEYDVDNDYWRNSYQ